MKKRKIARIIGIIILLIIIVLVMAYEIDYSQMDECVNDNDCVKASCCHASECVPKEKAPNCSNTMCTMECVPGTLDCNQGSCKCVKGKCKAVLN